MEMTWISTIWLAGSQGSQKQQSNLRAEICCLQGHSPASHFPVMVGCVTAAHIWLRGMSLGKAGGFLDLGDLWMLPPMMDCSPCSTKCKDDSIKRPRTRSRRLPVTVSDLVWLVLWFFMASSFTSFPCAGIMWTKRRVLHLYALLYVLLCTEEDVFSVGGWVF